jgi:DNA modification methylase
MELNKVYLGDALEVLKTFPDDSIDFCLTSPPYANLRSYLPVDHPDKCKEVGYEVTPDQYVDQIVNVFSEVHRVLKPSGCVMLNIGDSWASNGIYLKQYVESHPERQNLHTADHERYPAKVKGVRGGKYKIKKKDLMMIPARTAIALQEYGWYLRSDIIYAKRNVLPNPVKDRPVASYEHVFLLTKTPKYYFDWKAIGTEPADSTQADKRPKGVLRQKVNENSKYHENCDDKIAAQFRKQDNVGRSDYTGFNDRYTPVDLVRPRDVWYIDIDDDDTDIIPVWTMTVTGSKIKHFAMMESKLAEKCIKCGCPENGVVLDPFCGANTSGLVATSLNRNYIGIELNPDTVKIAENYLNDYNYDLEKQRVVKR